jgi:hypothetical protein
MRELRSSNARSKTEVNLSLFFLRSIIVATIIVAATDVIVFYHVVGRGIAQITPLFVLLVS